MWLVCLKPVWICLLWLCDDDSLPSVCRSLTVCSLVVQCADVVYGLGVLLDSELSMQRHTSKVVSACFYHLRRLRQIQNCVSQDVMAQLVMSLVISRLDCCNSVLSGLPASSLAPPQRVQNAAARLVVSLDRQSHITLAVQQLHWLPVKFRIIFKNAALMYQILHNCCPSYLADLVEFNTADSQRRQLRSSLTRAAIVKPTRTQFGKRVFSVCGPHTRNILPSASATLTVIQHSDELSSHICFIVLLLLNF